LELNNFTQHRGVSTPLCWVKLFNSNGLLSQLLMADAAQTPDSSAGNEKEGSLSEGVSE